MKFTLINIDKNIAILINSQDEKITVLKSLLPENSNTGDVLFINISKEEKPEAKKILNELLDIE